MNKINKKEVKTALKDLNLLFDVELEDKINNKPSVRIRFIGEIKITFDLLNKVSQRLGTEHINIGRFLDAPGWQSDAGTWWPTVVGAYYLQVWWD